MRRETERRPVDTKVLRENFRNGLERSMNRLMSEGYEPMGGISTHMNTHTRPILGIDSQEYTQTMVQYADFEFWVKETDEERAAYSDENLAESLNSQIEAIKKGVALHMKQLKRLEDALSRTVVEESPVKRSIFKRAKHYVDTLVLKDRQSQLEITKAKLATRKSSYDELMKEIAPVNERLTKFYKSNPAVTKDILMNSR